MKPITFDTLSDIHRIDLYTDEKRSCVAFVNKIHKNDQRRSLFYIILSLMPLLYIFIPISVFALTNTNPFNQKGIITIILYIITAGIMLLILSPIIHDFPILIKTAYIGKDGYIIEIFTFDDEIGRKEKDYIFIRKDGFYNYKYNHIINTLFDSVDYIYNDEPLDIIMEE